VHKMDESSNVFDLSNDQPGFEALAKPNGQTFWAESDLRGCLGYGDTAAFRRVVMRAMQACLSLGILTEDNFVRDENGEYKLTRFACYLVAMNGDSKKERVAAAQVYFASLAATYATHLEHADGIERIVIRDEITVGEKTLAGTAKSHGIAPRGYGLFKDAGYRGMYNMSLKQLRSAKGLKDNATVADHMGRAELAAHLFRITQTEARIEQQNTHGQKNLESAARMVGQNVRRLVKENTGVAPEELPVAEPINKVRTKLKGTNRNLTKLDD
jgi:DNA-damage-inducible protein D